jgi:hypothetical protein
MKSTSASDNAVLVWGKEVDGLRCSLTVPANRWQEGSPVVVTVTLQNRSDRKRELDSIPSFELDGYWCPVNLMKNGHSLGANERCRVVLPKSGSLTARYDLSQIGWDAAGSSSWPAGALFTLVPTGKYQLHMDIEVPDRNQAKHIRSNAVEIRVEK